MSHGKFLGPEEMKLFKKEIGWPEQPTFFIPEEVHQFFQSLQGKFSQYESDWNEKYKLAISQNPEKAKLWDVYSNKVLPDDFEDQLWNLDIEPDQPTRKYNEALVAKIAELLPFYITGSADVSSVDFTWLPERIAVSKDDWSRQQIKFGVREFCMAACSYGMQLHGMLQPVAGTFLVFSDYMRNAVRLAALMKQRVIFVYSHDSIMIGQDGPTHQPVEQLMSLRLMPSLTLIRPGDENECKAAWAAAFTVQDQPVALCFTRQPLKSTVSDLTREKAREGLKRGAYILYGEPEVAVNVEIFTSGSEIHASVGAARILEAEGLTTRVISIPSWELFKNQNQEYQQKILNGSAELKVSVEAGSGMGWEYFVGQGGLIISQETYGASAPEPVMVEHFGFGEDQIAGKIRKKLKHPPHK